MGDPRLREVDSIKWQAPLPPNHPLLFSVRVPVSYARVQKVRGSDCGHQKAAVGSGDQVAHTRNRQKVAAVGVVSRDQLEGAAGSSRLQRSAGVSGGCRQAAICRYEHYYL